MRLIYLALGVLCLVSTVHSQSHDEEETVHFEGSANAPTDDEDIEESSGLPPDRIYATSPVMPKVTTTPSTTTTTRATTTTTHPRQTTTLVHQQKVQTVATKPPRITTYHRPTNENGEENDLWAHVQYWVVIVMLLVIAVIFIGIVVIICCCKMPKQRGYTPAKQTTELEN